QLGPGNGVFALAKLLVVWGEVEDFVRLSRDQVAFLGIDVWFWVAARAFDFLREHCHGGIPGDAGVELAHSLVLAGGEERKNSGSSSRDDPSSDKISFHVEISCFWSNPAVFTGIKEK